MTLEQNQTQSRGPAKPLTPPRYMTENNRGPAEPTPLWLKIVMGGVAVAALVAANYIGSSKVEDNYTPTTTTEQPAGDNIQIDE